MNIGKISKPSVDRVQIKKKTNLQSTSPITASKEVSDLIELSEESRRQYEQEMIHRANDDKDNQSGKSNTDSDQSSPSNIIDVKV